MKNQIISTELLVVNKEDYALDSENAKALTIGLEPVRAERALIRDEFNELQNIEVTKDNIALFKKCRLRLVTNRTQGTNKWHKAKKSIPLYMGKMIDAIKNSENYENESMEAILLAKENHFENIEIERLRILQQDREVLICEYVEDPSLHRLSEMDEDTFEGFLHIKKTKYLAAIAEQKEVERLQAERVENERIENERIRVENAKLKAEADKKEKLRIAAKAKADAEAKKLQAENNAKLEAQRKVAAKIKADADAKALEEKRISDAKIKKANDEADILKKVAQKLRLEAKAKADAGADKLARIETERQNELSKGDEAKFQDLLNDLESLKTKYTFKSNVNIEKYNQVSILIDEIKNHIK